jgi:hypothetical protein
VEFCVLTDSLLGSTDEWQLAIEAAGFPLRISDEGRISRDGGTLVARLRDQATIFQYWIEDPSDVMNAYPKVKFGHHWKYAVAFPYIREFAELTSAWMAAAAYARATAGVVFDEQAGRVFGRDELVEETRRVERDAAEAEAMARAVSLRSLKP